MPFLRDRVEVGSKRIYSDEGFLTVPAKIARCGTQPYLASEIGLGGDPNRLVVVWRPPEEVLKKDSLDSFSNKPVTNDHPPVLVDTENFKQFTIGHAGPDVTHDGEFVSVLITINDKQAIEDVEAGKAEMSNGYKCDIEVIKGVTPGGVNYDAIQRNIRGNHIAIVAKGRAGEQVRLADNLTIKKVHTMLVTIDGVDFEISDQAAAQAVRKQLSRIGDMEKEAEEKDEEIENLKKKSKDDDKNGEDKEKATNDAWQAKLDDLNSKILDTAALDKLIGDRVALLAKAKVLAPNVNFDGKSESEINKAAVIARSPALKDSKESDEYFKIRFNIMSEDNLISPANPMDAAFSSSVTPIAGLQIGDAVDLRSPSTIARDSAAERNGNRWKQQQGDK